MPLTKDELLIPRWKVISDIPFKPSDQMFNVGDIITNDGKTAARDQNGDAVFISDWNKYPVIFQPLPWWSDRKPEDICEYVKLNPENTIGGEQVFKVIDVKEYTDGIGISIDPSMYLESDVIENGLSHIHCKYFIPSSYEEYTAYINQKQQ